MSTIHHIYGTIIATKFHVFTVLLVHYGFCFLQQECPFLYTVLLHMHYIFKFSSLFLKSSQKQILLGTNRLLEWRVITILWESNPGSLDIQYYRTNVIHANKPYTCFSFSFPHVSQADLQLSVEQRMTFNSGSSCLHFPNAGSLQASTTIPSRTLFLKIIKKEQTKKQTKKNPNKQTNPQLSREWLLPHFLGSF